MIAVYLSVALAVQAHPFGIPAKLLKPKPAPTTVLAKVNGAPIRAEDVEALLWEWRAGEVVEELVNYAMLRAEATKLGVAVTEAECLAESERQIKLLANSLEPGKTLAQTFADEGTGPSRVFLRVRNKLLLDGIALKSFVPSDYISVSTMIFRPKSEQIGDLSDAIQRAEAAFAKLKAGAVWDQVLRETTNDPETLKSQGNLGWRKLTAFPETVEKELKTLKVGDISKPAQTVNGIQFFRVQKLGKEAQGAELESLTEQFLAAARPEVFDRVKKNSKVER